MRKVVNDSASVSGFLVVAKEDGVIIRSHGGDV